MMRLWFMSEELVVDSYMTRGTAPILERDSVV